MKSYTLKYWELVEISKYLQQFKKIHSIYRTDYNTIRIEFDKRNIFYFNLQRGNSFIYIKPYEGVRREKLNAPFDTMLSNRFQKTEIEKIEIINEDKILRITTKSFHKYKTTTSSIQFEFTGKHTNIILLDENLVVLEALHHITEYQSIRVVQIGRKLENPPKPKFQFQSGKEIEDIREYLISKYWKYVEERISQLKIKGIKKLLSKIEKLQNRLENIESEERLLEESRRAKKIGELILIRLNSIPKYSDEVELVDLEGNTIKFQRPKEAKSNTHMADIFFNLAKRLEKKSINSRVEREHILEKIEFLEKQIQAIQNSSTIEEIEIITPKQEKREREEENLSIATFWIEGHKVMIGKSEKGNIELLENSRSNDIWLHLKDTPSAHVIIRTDRREVKKGILIEAGKLCAKFSTSEKGSYLVDYTKRKYVRIQKGSKVLYTNYKTIEVEI